VRETVEDSFRVLGEKKNNTTHLTGRRKFSTWADILNGIWNYIMQECGKTESPILYRF